MAGVLARQGDGTRGSARGRLGPVVGLTDGAPGTPEGFEIAPVPISTELWAVAGNGLEGEVLW